MKKYNLNVSFKEDVLNNLKHLNFEVTELLQNLSCNDGCSNVDFSKTKFDKFSNSLYIFQKLLNTIKEAE